LDELRERRDLLKAQGLDYRDAQNALAEATLTSLRARRADLYTARLEAWANGDPGAKHPNDFDDSEIDEGDQRHRQGARLPRLTPE